MLLSWWNAALDVETFLIVPGAIQFTTSQSTTPSFKTSAMSLLALPSGLPVTASIHP
jgi:hypothetical protein